MKKNPLEKLIVNSLGRPFYLNVIQFLNDDEKWFPMFYSEWSGSDNRLEAVKMRREAFTYLHDKGNKNWKPENLKTVKIELYKFR